MQSGTKTRPLGVTIIAILAIIGGILLVFGGLSLLVFGAFFSAVTFEDQQQLQPQEASELQPLTQFFGGFGIAIGAIILAVGVGYLVVSYGLLKGNGWARMVAVVLTIVAIVVQLAGVISSSVLSQSLPSDLEALASGIFAHIIGIAINGVILYYLYRPNVKAYFAKA
ncbi:MAG: hypothetical protein WBX01_05775 [Nitrososphaeraceae archaeon]